MDDDNYDGEKHDDEHQIKIHHYVRKLINLEIIMGKTCTFLRSTFLDSRGVDHNHHDGCYSEINNADNDTTIYNYIILLIILANTKSKTCTFFHARSLPLLFSTFSFHRHWRLLWPVIRNGQHNDGGGALRCHGGQSLRASQRMGWVWFWGGGISGYFEECRDAGVGRIRGRM